MSFPDRYRQMWPDASDLPRSWRRAGEFHLIRRVPTWLRPEAAWIRLHDPSCPFLRFYVRHSWAKQRWCNVCEGSGRVRRPQTERVFQIFSEAHRDPTDGEGLRRCLTCYGLGKVDAVYGRYDTVQYTPGLNPGIQTAPPRSKDDILGVVEWIDALVGRLRRLPRDPVEQLGREEVF